MEPESPILITPAPNSVFSLGSLNSSWESLACAKNSSKSTVFPDPSSSPSSTLASKTSFSTFLFSRKSEPLSPSSPFSILKTFARSP
uniref:Uncharacterized protein MANES_11G082600 n=1 Tax=Rhizophora mucronata TaxID=61149 RepID=A0A2P2J171_RHIMU